MVDRRIEGLALVVGWNRLLSGESLRRSKAWKGGRRSGKNQYREGMQVGESVKLCGGISIEDVEVVED